MTRRDHMGRPVVVVTGMGVVSPLGVGMADNWSALTAGRSGIRSIRRFPTEHLKTTIAGLVETLPSSHEGPSALTHEMAERAAAEALEQADIDRGDFGGPLFLAAPPSELDWTQRFRLHSAGADEPGYPALLAATREQPKR